MQFKDLESAMGLARILVKPTTPIAATIPKITPPPLNRRRRELVAGGDVIWKPVDRTAAKLLCKSPDICKPTYETEYSKTPDESATEGTKSKPAAMAGIHGVRRPKPEHAQRGKSGLDHAKQAVHRSEKRNTLIIMDDTEAVEDSAESKLAITTAKIKDRQRQLSASREDLQEARRALEDAIAGLRDVFREVDEFTKECVSSTRGTRMAAVAEMSQLANGLREVRKFFLGSEYTEETKRLREFVDLCERLKSLKDSGFLDSVADTMLKLS